MQSGFRGFCLACSPGWNLFCQSCISSSISLPVSQKDKSICDGLSHFLTWFHRYFAGEMRGFQLCYELCGIFETRCFFFSLNKTHLITFIASVTRDVRSKACLTTALSLEYILPVPCFSDSVFLSAALLLTFWQTSLQSELEGALWPILSQHDPRFS